jgi:hypothetical protein
MASERHEVQAHGLWGFASMPVVLLVAAIIVGLAALLPLMQSSGVATTAGNISQLQREHEDWQTRLEEQQLRVAQMSSLAAIRKAATERLGMVTPEDVRYITVDAPAPAPAAIPPDLLPEEQPQPESGNSLLDDIIGLLP